MAYWLPTCMGTQREVGVVDGNCSSGWQTKRIWTKTAYSACKQLSSWWSSQLANSNKIGSKHTTIKRPAKVMNATLEGTMKTRRQEKLLLEHLSLL